MNKTIIEITTKRSNSSNYDIRIKLADDINAKNPKRISGHRFVNLLRKKYVNDLGFILDCYSIKTFIQNIYTLAGTKLEPEIRETYNTGRKMIEFDYETFKGDGLGGDKDFIGLMDGYIPEIKTAIEIKTFSNPNKLVNWSYDIRLNKTVRNDFYIPEEYLNQIQLYWEINNRNQKDKYPIKDFILITHFIDDINNPEFNHRNVKVFDIKKDPDINTKIEIALVKKDYLLTPKKDGFLHCQIPREKYIDNYIEELSKQDNVVILQNKTTTPIFCGDSIEEYLECEEITPVYTCKKCGHEGDTMPKCEACGYLNLT